MSPGPLRVALLSYRSNPHSGGQGVYVDHLSRALTELGHHVEVFSGPPYPVLDPRVPLTRVESLDLYRTEDPFRRPRRDEFRDAIDVLEYAAMCCAGFPEPLTFSLRAAKVLKARAGDFDVVHDNQCLGYGLLSMARRGVPVVATIHHPIAIDRALELDHASGWKRRVALRRWYAFTRMQERVARRLPRIVTVSEQTRSDTVRWYGVPIDRMRVVHNGVDTELFRPLPHVETVPGRVVTTASGDGPLKGLVFLIEAIAKLRTERHVELVVVGREPDRGPVRAAIDSFGIGSHVRFEHRVDWLRLVELYAQAEVAVVPSLYEGFSLPAAEAMACEVPLVATSAGAVPEVTGLDGHAALLVAPKDAGALAGAIGKLLDDPRLRRRVGAAGRARVAARFSWRAAAAATAAVYREVVAGC